MHPTLTPRPTEAEIKAYEAEKVCGLDWAKAELNEQWVRHNMLALTGRVSNVLKTSARTGDTADNGTMALVAIVDLLTILSTAMDES